MRLNPFPTPTPLQKIMLAELVRVAERCYQRGWSWGTAGNFSIRGNNGLIWQSPSGLCKGELRGDLFVPVDLKTERPIEISSQSPSAEMPVHAGIYKAMPDAMCVVHTHPHEAVALSMIEHEFKFKDEEMSKALGAMSHKDEIRILIQPNPTPDEMKTYSPFVLAGITPPSKMIVLKGHGVYAWGRTPLEVMAYIEALEFLCQSHRFRRS
ncbi:MAG: class II aldolase/adducin family protein [Proteobacteria bacterium]|nr:class II aldolase/adducin family protein [Pseudomonadota bacterium]